MVFFTLLFLFYYLTLVLAVYYLMPVRLRNLVLLIASLFLDYIIAFAVLGLAGLFRKKGYSGMLCGIVLACFLRFFVHFLAGIILWANLEEFVAFGQTWINRPVLYSICSDQLRTDSGRSPVTAAVRKMNCAASCA